MAEVYSVAFQNIRARYVSDGAGTVSQARLLVMLYDRLVLDIQQACTALSNEQHELVNDKLCHAQAIIIEFRNALDHEAWAGAAQLDEIYIWLDSELMRCNVKKEEGGLYSCLRIARDLQEAWHGAYDVHIAEQAAKNAAGAAVAAQ